MSAASRGRRFAGNYLSTLAFIGLSCWIISDLSGFHRGLFQDRWRPMDGVDLTVYHLFYALAALYALALIPFYRRYPWLHSKAFVFLQGLWFSARRLRRPASPARLRRSLQPGRLPLRAGLSTAASQAGLVLLLKFFFAPLMINWCVNHAGAIGHSLEQLWQGLEQGLTGRQLFDRALFWACFQLILFVDTLLFTLGYVVEIPALGNRIRSVEPTFFGWFICLACYPPFNDVTGRAFAWQSTDFPHFTNTAVHLAANFLLLLSLVVYSWASVALGLKASNLTNRGIVTHGPYARVRHPAYAAKNLAWWIGALPALGLLLANGDWGRFGYALGCLCAWTAIYALRALTEERHLLRGENGYAEYLQRVRWRFIPGVL